MPTKNANILRADPTRTALIRRQFQAEIQRRVRDLKRDVWEFMVTLDALGLVTPRNPGELFPTRNECQIVHKRVASDCLTVNATVQPREFQFRTDADKVKAFREWLEEAQKARMLSPRKGEDPNKPWTAKYIESSYKKGKANAFASSRRKESAFDPKFFSKAQEKFLKSSFAQPESLRKVELLATRAFEELRGVNAQMAQQMNRILAQGMVDGKGPAAIAREMSKSVDGLTKKRALLIARTEVIHAHAEGQLDAFEELGVGKLTVMAEWTTAGDERVCPRCLDMEGRTFDLEEARGLIPLHPACRCSWQPFVKIISKKEKEKGSKKTKKKSEE